MPNYNCEPYLIEAIESILNQTYKNFELIIVDDGSLDNSLKIINDFVKKNKRVKSIPNKKNLGRPKTRDKLLSLVSEKSEYFMWMDSDDVVLKDILKDKVEFLEKHSKIDGVGSALDYVDEKLKFLFRRVYPEKSIEIEKAMALGNSMSQGGLLLRSKLKTEKYDNKYLVCQDYKMWIKLIKKGYKFYNLKKAYYLYRQFEGQGKQKNLKLSLWNTIKIKNEYIFTFDRISIKALIRYCVELIAMVVPKRIILWVFYKKRN